MELIANNWRSFVPSEHQSVITDDIAQIVTIAIQKAVNIFDHKPQSNIFKSYSPTEDESYCYGCGDKITGYGYRLTGKSLLYCSRLCFQDNH